jgi:hypothetical protein
LPQFLSLTRASPSSPTPAPRHQSAPVCPAEAKIAALDAKLSPARAAFSDARTKLSELESEQADLDKKLVGSYGEDDVFVALVDRCFEAKVRLRQSGRLLRGGGFELCGGKVPGTSTCTHAQCLTHLALPAAFVYCLHRRILVPPQVEKYTYEVCPFSKASQKEGHSSTSLGSWQGLEGEAEGALRMAFTNGQGCWQGPPRSMTVRCCLLAAAAVVGRNCALLSVVQFVLCTNLLCGIHKQFAPHLHTCDPPTLLPACPTAAGGAAVWRH